jgi:hypothetical protein
MKRIAISIVVLISCITINAQWFWQNPLPQGNSLASVKFISKSIGWVVGQGGTILRTRNGGDSFTDVNSKDKNFLQDSLPSQPEIKNYMQFLEKEKGHLSYGELKGKPLSYIKHLASMQYLAFDKDYAAMSSYIKNNKGIQGETEKIIEEKLGDKVSAFLQINYLVKIRIISRTIHSHNYDAGPPGIMSTVTILDIIKGENTFKPGDTLTYFYWLNPNRDHSTPKGIEIGDTVFVGLSVHDSVKSFDLTRIMFNAGKESNYARAQIMNDILVDKYNIWGYGKSVPWEDFKKNITQDIKNLILEK